MAPSMQERHCRSQEPAASRGRAVAAAGLGGRLRNCELASAKVSSMTPSPMRGGALGLAGLVLRIRLFISSYAPLFAMLVIRFEDRTLQVVCAVIATFGVATLAMLLHRARRIQPDPHRIESVTDRGAEVAGYLATYLLPFLTVTEPSGRDLGAYFLFLLVVGVVYVQSEMVQINPLLYVLLYRVWAVRTTDGWSGYLISRHTPRPNTTVLASRLANTLALEKRHEHSVAPQP